MINSSFYQDNIQHFYKKMMVKVMTKYQIEKKINFWLVYKFVSSDFKRQNEVW